MRRSGFQSEDGRASLLVFVPILQLLGKFEVVLTIHLQVTNVTFDEQTPGQSFLVQFTSAGGTLGVFADTFGDANQTEEVAVFALTRFVNELQADTTLQLLCRALVNDEVVVLKRRR